MDRDAAGDDKQVCMGCSIARGIPCLLALPASVKYFALPSIRMSLLVAPRREQEEGF
jgi:hypothetical protein